MNSFDRVPAEREEIVRDSDSVYAENILPNVCQQLFRFCARRFVFSCLRFDVRLRQRPSVDFSVRRNRKLIKLHPIRRYHVVRKRLPQLTGEAFCIKLFVRNDIAAQRFVAVGVFDVGDDCFLNFREPRELDFNFRKLDPEAADFHLLVDPADVLKPPVFQPFDRIPCPVHALARHKRVFRKTLRRFLRLVQIAARKPAAGDAQLASDADRLNFVVLSKHIRPRIGNRLSDRKHAFIRIDCCARRNDCVFRRPIVVDERVVPFFDPLQLVSARKQHAQRLVVELHELFAQLCRQERDRNPVLFEIFIQTRNVHPDRFIDDMKLRSGDPVREHLPDGSVKAEAGIFRAFVLFGDRECIVMPIAQVHERLMFDHDAFRLACRARCVNQVCQVVRLSLCAWIDVILGIKLAGQNGGFSIQIDHFSGKCVRHR